MTILVTRPGTQGQQLCNLLEGKGKSAIHHPLITIKENPQVVSVHHKLMWADIIIAVSVHAVQMANNYLQQQQQSWPSQKVYLAVGAKTAQYLSKVCAQSVNYPEQSDSEHFIQLPELRTCTNKNVLILRGNGGRELIRDSLLQAGANVDYCATYQREFIPFDVQRCLHHWQEKEITQVIITSGEQLSYFVEQFPPPQLQWLVQRQLFIPSQRIAAQAKTYGFNNIICTYGASNQNILAAL